MQFTTDKQTLDDLRIFTRPGMDSVYGIFSHTVTRGGAALLEEMFHYPLADIEAINERAGIINYFKENSIGFAFNSEEFDIIDQYLANTDERTKLDIHQNTLAKRLSSLIAQDADHKLINGGINAIVSVVNQLRDFTRDLKSMACSPFRNFQIAIIQVLNHEAINKLPVIDKIELSYEKLTEIDLLLRFRHRDIVKNLLRYIYQLDVYNTVGKIAAQRGFIFPNALPENQNIVRLEGVYHPEVSDAVSNSIIIDQYSNVVFLTGANMAGKSTFMKSVAVAVFLAHMGFPVAASKMEFSVLDGMFTTINLPDNLGMGNSHFYAEVLRVKKIAKELAQGKKLFVVIDELFRGTNVKDAHQATVAITAAFSRKRSSMFIISTHIIEAGEVLKTQCDSISFKFLPTSLVDNKPVYTYQLETGISADRHGMIIIKNERILEILKINKSATL